jgi:hypothetical protein
MLYGTSVLQSLDTRDTTERWMDVHVPDRRREHQRKETNNRRGGGFNGVLLYPIRAPLNVLLHDCSTQEPNMVVPSGR